MKICETCCWFVGSISACSRYPPTVLLAPPMRQALLGPDQGMALVPTGLLPPVNPKGFCGEWQSVTQQSTFQKTGPL